MEKVHPLIEAITLKEKALKSGADSRIVKNLDRIILERAKNSIEVMKKSSFVNSVISNENSDFVSSQLEIL